MGLKLSLSSIMAVKLMKLNVMVHVDFPEENQIYQLILGVLLKLKPEGEVTLLTSALYLNILFGLAMDVSFL